MKKFLLIALMFVGVQAFAQSQPKLPESVFQNSLSIKKDKSGNLVMKFKVSKTFNNDDVEAIKFYVQRYYGDNEKYIGWTPQITHRGKKWTFVFNK
jgi:hypothetical protein